MSCAGRIIFGSHLDYDDPAQDFKVLNGCCSMNRKSGANYSWIYEVGKRTPHRAE